MSPLDLVRSRDGSMSLTKLAAATGHFLFAVAVAWLTYIDRRFDQNMWSLYIATAVLHASYDKTLAAVMAFKDRKLDAVAPPMTTTTTVVQSSTQD